MCLHDIFTFINDPERIAVPVLRDLTVQINDNEAMSILYSFLESSGSFPALETFRCDLRDRCDLSDAYVVEVYQQIEQFPGAPLPLAERFSCITFTTDRREPIPVFSAMMWWNATLKSLPSTGRLTSLTLPYDADLEHSQPPLAEGWRELDHTLSNLSCLKSVTFVNKYSNPITLRNHSSTVDVRSVLPQLSGRGILSL
ncbi:hypothetical protein BDZ89DRAFT_102732 [Hymenopellis radicata]|nr:hypothetical protein BDZ89DRAFT_102732 [Hymenopellis radicata]